MKKILRGVYTTVKDFLLVSTTLTVVLGPLFMATEYNPTYLLLYFPHLLTFFYWLGSDPYEDR